ncbi:MAG: diguanylate cyclase [Desulfobulbaceae bacterium]|nr:MAG: diguanylate cyclase [Desulfobulbaceae bacterium]
MTKAKILIVDDKPQNLLVLESLIDDPAVELVKASSGDEALVHTLDHDFALVLLDVHMPGMDGYEVAELMRGNKATRNIPIIFITAEQKEQSHIFKGYDAGAVDYLFKPLEPVALKGKVAVFLDLFHHKEELKNKTVELDQKLQELEELQLELEKTNEQLTLLSNQDGLTGLLNRRRFDEIYFEEWQRGLRSKSPLSILLIDIDHFKAFNDHFGHMDGDESLRAVANTLALCARRHIDKVARYGGEEFIAILPDTDLAGAEKMAQTMCEEIYRLAINHPASEADQKLTVSIGAATAIPSMDVEPEELVIAADSKLYEAKGAGRNRWTSGLLNS